MSQRDGGTVIRVAVKGLVRGEAYTVRWRELSADGHIGTGVYTFGVGVDPPPADRGGRRVGDDVARRRGAVGAVLRARAADRRRRDPPPRPAAGRRRARRAARPRARHPRGRARRERRARRVRDPLRERAPGLERRPACTPTSRRSPSRRASGGPSSSRRSASGSASTILAVAWVLDRPSLRWPAFLLALALVWGYPALRPPGDRAERLGASARSRTGSTSSRR